MKKTSFSNSHVNRLRIFAISVMLAMALGACDSNRIERPRMVATYTFSQLAAGEEIGFQLAEFDASALLVRIDGHETTLESSVLTDSGQSVSVVSLPILRLGPVFQVIETKPKAGPFEIRVTPRQLTAESNIQIRVLALPEETEIDEARLEAYKSYERAVQSPREDSHEARVQRINDLRLAAAGFARSDEIEEQLWANFLEACVLYTDQQDYALAMDQLGKIQQRAGRLNLNHIRLAAVLLEGKVLITPQDGDSAEEVHQKHVKGQEVLQAGADLAAEFELPFEQAWALKARGDSYLELGSFTFAETMFRKALEIAQLIGDQDLESLIYENLAKAEIGKLNSD